MRLGEIDTVEYFFSLTAESPRSNAPLTKALKIQQANGPF